MFLNTYRKKAYVALLNPSFIQYAKRLLLTKQKYVDKSGLATLVSKQGLLIQPTPLSYCKSQTCNQKKCVRKRGSASDSSHYLHNFRIISFIMVLEVWGALPGTIKSDSVLPTVSHRCNVSSKLCCPDAKPRIWAMLLVTRFGVISRV